MSANYSKFLTFIICCLGISAQAQDSLSLYQNIENQLNQFRILNSEYYCNPANMAGYSTYSFSNIGLNYQNLNKEAYLLQEGKSHKTFSLYTNSYKATTKNTTLWGGASYTNTETKNVQWNNTLDLDRTASMVIADSVGGTMNLQTYRFNGGLAKNFTKFTLGGEVAYKADLSYKTQDPRPKNVTSDLYLKVGGTYHLNSNYNMGFSAGINRYIQTSTIKFSSEVYQNALYQMNGLGTYNFYFSNKTEGAFYNDFSHHYLFTFGTADDLFTVTAGTLFGTLSKDVNIGNYSYEINRLALRKSFASILKVFNLTDSYKIGGKINYHKTNKTGTEVLYSNNTGILQKLLEKENYEFSNSELSFNVVLQYQNNGSTVYLQPFYTVSQTKESKYDPASQQNFDDHFAGIKLWYLQQLNKTNSLSFTADIYQRTVKKASDLNMLTLSQHQGINQWLINDYNFKNTNYKALQAALRYDVKVLPKQSIYAIFALDYFKFSNSAVNTQSTFSLGITF